MRVAGQDQDAGGGREHERDADDRFLYLRPAPVGPVQDAGRDQRGRYRRELHHPATRLPAHGVGGNHSESRDLRDGKVDEDDAAAQYFHAQRHVGAEYQQTRDERGKDDTQLELAHCR